ncbi:hypothetical protein [Coraliomargarita parva]|uniref:hypothetical protein n=1 Tax=Coraliomargarita parva TaxID=3014050 RepID=UPI0022B4057E|nr:hypothetical protein [Coraliomargarita parva]
MKLIQLVLLSASVMVVTELIGFQSIEDTIEIQKIRDDASFRLLARFDGGYEIGVRKEKPSGSIDIEAPKGKIKKGEYLAVYENMVFTEKQIKPFLMNHLGDRAKELCVVEIPILFTSENPTTNDERRVIKNVIALLGETGFKEYVIMRHYGSGIVILDRGRL